MKIATLIFIMMVTLQVNAQDTSRVKSVFAKQILYSIKYSRGENYDSTKSIYKQDLTEHGRYMQKLFNEGKLILAGPFIDNPGRPGYYTGRLRKRGNNHNAKRPCDSKKYL